MNYVVHTTLNDENHLLLIGRRACVWAIVLAAAHRLPRADAADGREAGGAHARHKLPQERSRLQESGQRNKLYIFILYKLVTNRYQNPEE